MSGGRVAGAEIERLVQLLARLPGLGPRSARRAVLTMIKSREQLLQPLGRAMAEVAEKILVCETCGSVDVVSPCTLCRDPARDPALLCVVEEVGDLWALERAAVLKGRYHVLGGVLSALDGVGPEDLAIPALIERVKRDNIAEVVLAMNATVDGQATAHYIIDHLEALPCQVTRLAHGVPVGGELDYLDEGTLTQAFQARRPL